jgi:hypothetical protein
MTRSSAMLASLLVIGAVASPPSGAAEILLAGHVQRVILQPSGTPDCPPPCADFAPLPDGSRVVCVTNQGGCQAMEMKVDQVYLGQAGATHTFRSRIGEWGPSFPVTTQQIVVRQEGTSVWWSPATLREGRVYIDPKRLHTIGGVATAADGADGELVALDEVLGRVNAGAD